MITVVKVPRNIADYAEERAKREFLRASEVVRSLMQRGLIADQAERRKSESN